MIPLCKHASFHDVNCKLLVSAIIANIGQHAPFHILLPVFIAFQLHLKAVDCKLTLVYLYSIVVAPYLLTLTEIHNQHWFQSLTLSPVLKNLLCFWFQLISNRCLQRSCMWIVDEFGEWKSCLNEIQVDGCWFRIASPLITVLQFWVLSRNAISQACNVLLWSMYPCLCNFRCTLIL